VVPSRIPDAVAGAAVVVDGELAGSEREHGRDLAVELARPLPLATEAADETPVRRVDEHVVGAAVGDVHVPVVVGRHGVGLVEAVVGVVGVAPDLDLTNHADRFALALVDGNAAILEDAGSLRHRDRPVGKDKGLAGARGESNEGGRNEREPGELPTPSAP
jgi:hypothetical protein